MTGSIAAQICLIFSLIAIGSEAILRSGSLPRYGRIARAHLVNFFLFLFLSCATVTALAAAFKKEVPYGLAGVAIASSACMVFVIVWLVPVIHSVQRQNTGAAIRTVFVKAIYSLAVFGIPIGVGIHTYQYRDYYFANSRSFDEYIAETSPSPQPSPKSGTEAAPTPTPTATPTPLTPVLQYVAAIDLHFLSNTKLQCTQSDSKCNKIQNVLNRTQNNRTVFLLKLVFAFLCLYLVLRFYGRLVELRIKRQPRVPGDLGLQSDVIEQCTQIVAISAALFLSLIFSGVDFSSLGIFAGLIAAGLSVAMRDVLGNVVAGILLLWGKTIKANDVITIPRSQSSDTGATYGVVRRMTMRYTIVEDRNEVRRLIPNSKLTDNTIENWTHEDRSVRLRVLVDVDYSTDLRHARSVLESVCYEVPKIDTKKQPPKAVVIGFGDSAIHMSLRFWVNEPHKGIRPILSDIYIAIVERFREEGIKIPYPQMELELKTPAVKTSNARAWEYN